MQVREPLPRATSPLLEMATVNKGVETHQLSLMELQPEPRLSPLLTFTKTQTGKASSRAIKSETPSTPPTATPPPRRATREVAAIRGNTISGNNASPSRNKRSRCASISSLSLLAAAQFRAEHWTPDHLKYEESPLSPLCEMANGVLHKKEVLNYIQLIQNPTLGDYWKLSSANEFGRLAQGIGGRVKGTNTVFFIEKSEVPPERFKDATYGTFSA